MHRKSRLPLARNAVDRAARLLLLLVFVFSGTRFFAKNPYVAAASSDNSKGCNELTCKIGEQCVSRKFWCNHSPCPTMTYCSKSRKESLKGPETCESVLCASGYKCIVRVRDCEWHQKCKERAARCVTEGEFHEGPASCVDVVCPTSHRCVLRETHCHRPPCKLTKSCARDRDIHVWFEKCKQLGCHSEHDCFLRRPPEECGMPSCNHVPDCLSTINLGDDEDEHCRGWICPPSLECGSSAESACKRTTNDCPVTRTCREPLMQGTDSDRDYEPIDILPPRTTLADLEREVVLEERRRLLNFLKPTSASNFTKLQRRPVHSFHEITPNPEYAGGAPSPAKTKRVTAMPIMRGTSSAGYSPWLTYLKRKAGAEAVQYWIEKAKNNEDHEEFAEWLESVEELLEPETYRLWLRELELASASVPEFQSWISPRNPAADPHRSAAVSQRLEPPYARRRLPALHHAGAPEVPGSIGGDDETVGRARDLFYADQSHLPTEPHSHSNSDPRQQQQQQQWPLAEKQTVPTIIAAHPHVPGAGYENASQRYHPSNFNFNEAGRFDHSTRTFHRQGAQSAPPPPPIPYLEIARPRAPLDLAGSRRQQQQLPESQAQEFSDTVKNSWKSWQSYYQLSPPPPTNPPGFPAAAAVARDSYLYSSNYAPARENFSISAVPSLGIQQQQPQIFFPNVQIDFGKAAAAAGQQANSNSNQWATRRTSELPVKQIKLDDNFHGGHNGPGGYGKPEGDSRSMGPGSMMLDQITGLQQFSQLKPNVIKLDPSQPVSQLLLSSNSVDEENPPNLLIYFPPPLNFFIYYSVGGKNQNASKNSTSVSQGSRTENRRRIFPSEISSLNSSKSSKNLGDKNPSVDDGQLKSNSENFNKTGKFDKNKELEYIRKIIKELMQYWDEEEKSLEHSKKHNDELYNKNVDSKNNNREKNANINSNAQSENNKSPNKDNSKPTFSTFLEWLTKNSTLLDQRSRKKKPPVYDEYEDYTKYNENSGNRKLSSDNPINLPPYSEDSNDATSKKIRILVDIDKNPELLKALLSRNKTNNKNVSDSHEYQIIMNLNDFVDPKEEELITRKLINIASNQLHKNFTNDQKIPKVLWVFPVYEDEDNVTLINQINKINKEKVNTLDDVNAPTTGTDKNEKTSFITKTPNANLNASELTAGLKDANSTQQRLKINHYDEDDDDAAVEDSANDPNDDYEEKESYDE